MADTKKLRSYIELLKDLDVEAKAAAVAQLQQEEALSRAGRSTDDLRRKYDLDGMGN